MYLNLYHPLATSSSAAPSAHFPLPADIATVIIRELRGDLDALACTNKELQSWRKKLLPQESKVPVLIARMNRLSWKFLPSPLIEEIEYFEAEFPFLVEAQARSLLGTWANLLLDCSPGPNLYALPKALEKVLQLAEHSRPTQMATILAMISPRPFGQPTTEELDVRMRAAIDALEKRSPAWARTVDFVRTAKAYNAFAGSRQSQWEALLKDVVRFNSFPDFVASRVMRNGAALSWNFDLKPYWFALILSTTDPAKTSLAFAKCLAIGVDTRSFAEAVAENPESPLWMCNSLVQCCKPQGEKTVVDVLAAYCRVIIKMQAAAHANVKTRAFLAVVKQAANMEDDSQGALAAVLITQLTAPGKQLTSSPIMQGQFEGLLNMLCKHPEPTANVLGRALSLAIRLKGDAYRKACAGLLKKVEPADRREVALTLRECLGIISTRRRQTKVDEILKAFKQ